LIESKNETPILQPACDFIVNSKLHLVTVSEFILDFYQVSINQISKIPSEEGVPQIAIKLIFLGILLSEGFSLLVHMSPCL